MSEVMEPTAETTDQTSTALAVIRTALPTILAADTNDILGKLAGKVKAFRPDISTAKGRDAIRSLAAEIASSKVTLVKLGKSLTANWREQTKAVNEECNIIEEKMDALKVQVRQPLTDFENAEKDRVAGHEAALAAITVLTADVRDMSSDAILGRLVELELIDRSGRAWEEFSARAISDIAATGTFLRHALDDATARETEAAELAQLRAAEAERARLAAIEAQRQREEQIAAAAAEAARVAAEAEAKRKAEEVRQAAQRAATEAAEAIAAAERRTEQEREIARQVAERAETVRVAAHRAALETMRKLAAPLAPPDPVAVIDAKIAQLEDIRTSREWDEFEDTAAGAFIGCMATLQNARVESIRLATEAAERKRAADEAAEAQRQADAVEAERKRAAAVKAAEEAEAKKRAANREHKAKINGEALVDMTAVLRTVMSAIVDGDEEPAAQIAKEIVRALAKNEIRNCKIEY